MKKLVILCCILLAGCASAHIETETALDDGSVEKCTAGYSSFWKDSDTASMGACGAGGSVEGARSSDALVQLLLRALAVPAP